MMLKTEAIFDLLKEQHLLIASIPGSVKGHLPRLDVYEVTG